MNPDDPKFTAHVLGELDDLSPAERAKIEALLASDPAAAAEARETQALAARLRTELPGEQAAALDEAQRAAVLAAAQASPKIVELQPRPWILGSWVPRSIAAALVIGAALTALMTARNYLGWQTYLGSSGIGDPRSPESRFDRFAIKVGDAVSGSNLAGLYGIQTGSGRIAAFEEASAKTRNSFASPDHPRVEGLVSMPEVASLPAETPQLALAQQAPVLAPTAPGQLAAITTTNLTTASPGSVSITINPPAAPSFLAPASAAPPSRLIGKEVADKISSLSAGWAKGGASSFSRPLDERGLVAGLKPGEVGGAPAGVTRMGVRAASAALPANGQVTSDGSGLVSWVMESDVTRDGVKRRDDLVVLTPAPVDREAFDAITDNAFLAARENPLSTLSIDVDTASYAIVRRYLNGNQRPPKGAVRIEELLNYFPYEYPQPQGDEPFSATMEVAACPWTPEHRLVRIGLKGREIAKDKRPASNLVFLLDVSGSMRPANKLPLLKQSLALLIDQLGDEDQVGIVVYAGGSGTVLEPTREKGRMHAALHQLEAGGSTNGASGLQLAYELAQRHFIKDGTNRVILATDGDWNVGTTSQSELLDLIAAKAKSGVFLTVLGLGMGNLNDSMMVKLAGRGNGNYAYLDTLAEAKKVLVEQLSGTLVTIAKDVKIQVEFNPAQVGAYRLIGYEKRLLAKEDFNDDKKDAGEIGAGHTVTALYEVVPVGKEARFAVPVDPLKYQTPPASAASPVIPHPAPSLPGRSPQPARGLERRSPEPAPTDFKAYLLGERVAGNGDAAAPSAVRPGIAAQTAASRELLTLKLRYKEPAGDTSKLLEFPLTDSGAPWERSTPDFRFAAAVAGYGMLLRDSRHKGAATWGAVEEWAQEGLVADASGYRAEFLTLIEKARALTR